MNEAINLMPGAAVPGTATAPTGGQPGAAGITGDAPGAVFQELLTQALGTADPQMAAVAARAGQQSPEESTEAEAPSDEKGNLLGSSTETAPSTLGAAQAVAATPEFTPVVEAQSQVQATEPAAQVTSVAVETIAPAETVGTPGEAAQPTPSPAVQNTASEAVEPVVVTPVEQAAQSALELVAVSSDDQPAQPTQPTVDPAPDAQTAASTEVPQTPAKASEPTADVKAVHVKEPREVNHARDIHHAQDVNPEPKHVRTDAEPATAADPSLPESPAPSTGDSTLDYGSLRLKAKPEVDVKAHEEARAKEIVGSLARTPDNRHAAAGTTNPVNEQEKVVIGKTAAIAQAVEASSDAAIPVRTKQPAESGTQDTPQQQKGNGSPWTVSDVSPSFEKSVTGAQNSQGFHAPERVIEQKVIHQIVQSARLQMVDGGANMTLRLDPPHLGVLNMSVSTQEGAVVANIQTSTETARQVLQADLPTLKQALSDAGIVVDSINVSLSNTPDQPGTPHNDHRAYGQNHGRHTGSQFGQESMSAGPEPSALGVRAEQVAGVLDYLA